MRKAALIVAIVMGMSIALAQSKVGPNWPTDKYKAFAESRKKNKLVFLYYTSTS